MVFSSITFLFFFLPFTLIAYGMTRKVGLQNAILLIASLIFYTWGEPRFLPVLLASIAISYLCGRGIASADGTRRRHWLALGIVLNLALLVVFKYANFIAENYNTIARDFGLPLWSLPKIPLALGISFFVFQAISYLVDVYRRQARPARSLATVALYIAMFPQLVAGPIVRYSTVDRHLRQRQRTHGRTAFGWRLFVIGLAQKVLIADQVALLVDPAWAASATASLGIGMAWLAMTAYSLQIYFDFAGYSNMAIGIGLMLGFGFPRNFRFPYLSRSVTEFWRRWHMSLSSWFRDYLYIPLGGSRAGALKTYRNLLTVFVLCGLWHGASWTFLIWGLHHGLFLVLERTLLRRFVNGGRRWLQHAYALFVVVTGWVWFRADSLHDALSMFRAMFSLNANDASEAMLNALNPLTLLAVCMGILWAADIPGQLKRKLRNRTTRRGVSAAVISETQLVAVLLITLSFVASTSYSPFLYFRF